MFLASPSLWTLPRREPPALAADTVVDIAIVGAGIAGVTTAALLQPLGLSVLLLDAAAPGAGMTRRSTAHISNAVDEGWRALVPRLGPAGARHAAQAYAAARAEIALLQQAIPCDYARVDGYIIGTAGDTPTLAAELAAAQDAGIDAAWLAQSPLPGVPTAGGLVFPGQARLHPLKYLDGLLSRFLGAGGLVRQGRALSVHGGAPPRVCTAAGPVVTARHGVIVATNTQSVHSALPPQTLYTSYTLAFSAAKGSIADGVMWDLDDPYHYIRLQPCAEHDIVLIGGEDHVADVPADPAQRFAALEVWARRAFPALGEITARWMGNVKQTKDNLAYCGRWPGAANVFLVDGDGGLGFTHATIGALSIRGALQDQAPPWARLFDPARYGAGKHPLIPVSG